MEKISLQGFGVQTAKKIGLVAVGVTGLVACSGGKELPATVIAGPNGQNIAMPDSAGQLEYNSLDDCLRDVKGGKLKLIGEITDPNKSCQEERTSSGGTRYVGPYVLNGSRPSSSASTGFRPTSKTSFAPPAGQSLARNVTQASPGSKASISSRGGLATPKGGSPSGAKVGGSSS